MLSWFKRKKPAAKPPAHQSMVQVINVAFSDGERTWQESADLLQILERVLVEQNNHRVSKLDQWLLLDDSGVTLGPSLENLTPVHQKGVQTVTTIDIRHAAFNVERIYEYQHSSGNSTEESLAFGFDQWAKTDLVALLDALRTAPVDCTTLDMEFPASGTTPARHRQAVLGPVAHTCERPRPPRERPPENQDDHDFCPCCLLTHSFEAFKKLIEDDTLYGIRLLALRDQNGDAAADCRVNGEEWEAGKKALRSYVSTWDDAGFEMRKQYVVLRTVPNAQPQD
jgi:hypothetical protein